MGQAETVTRGSARVGSSPASGETRWLASELTIGQHQQLVDQSRPRSRVRPSSLIAALDKFASVRLDQDNLIRMPSIAEHSSDERAIGLWTDPYLAMRNRPERIELPGNRTDPRQPQHDVVSLDCLKVITTQQQASCPTRYKRPDHMSVARTKSIIGHGARSRARPVRRTAIRDAAKKRGGQRQQGDKADSSSRRWRAPEGEPRSSPAIYQTRHAKPSELRRHAPYQPQLSD